MAAVEEQKAFYFKLEKSRFLCCMVKDVCPIKEFQTGLREDS